MEYDYPPYPKRTRRERPSGIHGDNLSPSWSAINERNNWLRRSAKRQEAWENRSCKPRELCIYKICFVRLKCTWYSYQIEKLLKV